jgi:hypothetical protein
MAERQLPKLRGRREGAVDFRERFWRVSQIAVCEGLPAHRELGPIEHQFPAFIDHDAAGIGLLSFGSDAMR